MHSAGLDYYQSLVSITRQSPPIRYDIPYHLALCFTQNVATVTLYSRWPYIVRVCVTKIYPHYTGHPHYIKTGHYRGV